MNVRSGSSTARVVTLVVLACAAAVAAIIGYAHRDRVAAVWRHRVIGDSGSRIAVAKAFPSLDLVSQSGTRVLFVPPPGKVTFVNVFATWCPPCRAESPAYARFAVDAAKRGIAIVAIDRAETPDKIEAYRREYGLNFPYFIDDGRETKDVLNARAMPVTIVVDAKGIVRADIAGPVTFERLEALAAQAERSL